MKLTKSYVINIKSNRNKYLHFSNQAKLINLNFSFFEAITPKIMSKTKFLYRTNEAELNFGRPLMKTEIACALSHISLWQKLLDDNKYDFYLIFEDDVYFNKELNFFVNNQDLNSYDLIRLCGNKIRYHKKIKDVSKDSSLVEFSYGCLTGAAYRISKKGAIKLLDYCNNLKFPIDILLDRSFDHGVKNYGILPFPVKTDWHNNEKDPLYTDIGIRKSKSNNISLKKKFIRKINRIKTSYFRRISALKLFLEFDMNISNDIKLKDSIKHFCLIKNKFYKLIVIFWLLGPFFFLLERSPADIWLSLIVLIFLLKSIIFKDWKWFQIKWFKFIFLFWIVSLTSALLSPMPIFTFGEGFFWIRFPLYAVCVQYWIGKERSIRIIMLYILFLCILMMSGILLAEYIIEPKYRLTWPYGDTIPGGYLAKFCLPITCVITSIIMTKLSSRNIFNGLLIIFTFCVSFLTGERTNFLIRFCSSLIATFCLKYSIKSVLFWIIIFFTAMYITVKFDRSVEKSANIESTYQNNNISTDKKIKIIRFENFLKDIPFLNFDEKNSYWGTWRSGLQQGFETPVLGIGPSGTRFTCGYLEKNNWLPGKNYCGNHPHNTYIQLFAETGIIGLFLFSISLFFMFQECYKARLINKKCIMASTAFIIPIAFFFPIQQSGSFFGQWNNLFMWFSIGFALSQSNFIGSNEK